MKPIFIARSLVMSALCSSAFAAAPATSTTLEVNVVGLNCSLCSEEMKSKLKTLAGARDIEPRLECGKIYFDMPPGAQLDARILSATLMSRGFTYEGSQLSTKSVADVRKTAEDQC